jgi:hypothetical protein
VSGEGRERKIRITIKIRIRRLVEFATEAIG